MAAVCGLHHAVLRRLQVQYTHTRTHAEMSTHLVISRTRKDQKAGVFPEKCVSLPLAGLQSLLQMAPETAPSPKSVHSLRLRETMLRVEVAPLIVSLETFFYFFIIFNLTYINYEIKWIRLRHCFIVLSIFSSALKTFYRSTREIQVFCFVQLSPLIAFSLFRVFYSRSSTVESRGPSALACLEHRWPSLFVTFTETLEKILLLSCNLSALFFSRQHQLAILGLYYCLTCLFFILIKKSPLSLANVSYDCKNLRLSYSPKWFIILHQRCGSTPQMGDAPPVNRPIMVFQSCM